MSEWDIVRWAQEEQLVDEKIYRALHLECNEVAFAVGPDGASREWVGGIGKNVPIVFWKCKECNKKVPKYLGKILIVINGIQ